MKAKFEVIEKPGINFDGLQYYFCAIKRDGKVVASCNGLFPEWARKDAIARLSLADFIAFEEWYDHRQYPGWKLALWAGVVLILVLLLVGWAVIR